MQKLGQILHLTNKNKSKNKIWRTLLSRIKYNRPDQSAIDNHCVSTGHAISNSKVLKNFKEFVKLKYLNAWEIYYMISSNEEKLLNNRYEPILNSLLLRSGFIKQLV